MMCNNADMNRSVQIPESLFSVLLNISLVMELLGHVAIILSTFCEVSRISYSNGTTLHSYQHIHEGSNFSTPYQHLLFS